MIISIKITKIPVIIAVVITLNSCSLFHSPRSNFYSPGDVVSDVVSMNHDDILNNLNEESKNFIVNNPTALLKLNYIKKTNTIDAQIITSWNEAPQGSVYLIWSAPKETNCYSTSFPITKYKNDQDYIKSSRSVISKKEICKGKWTATIIYKFDNSELARESITI